MGRRQPWESLDPDYRSRLERKGITAEMHQAGASITSGRGHGQTPERPSQAKNNDRFREYNDRRNSLRSSIQDLKRDLFGNTRKWRDQGAREASQHDKDGKPWGVKDLQKIDRVLRQMKQNNKDLVWAMSQLDKRLRYALFYH